MGLGLGLGIGYARLGRPQYEVLAPGHLHEDRVRGIVVGVRRGAWLRVRARVRVRVRVGVGVRVRVRVGVRVRVRVRLRLRVRVHDLGVGGAQAFGLVRLERLEEG